MDTAAIIAAISAVPATLAAIAAVISAVKSNTVGNKFGQMQTRFEELSKKDQIMSAALVELIEKDEKILSLLNRHIRNRKAHSGG